MEKKEEQSPEQPEVNPI